MRTNEGLSIFFQFGFVERGQSNAHIIGRCPLCGRDDHFFINVESANKSWDCKSCGRSGGFQMFLNQIVDTCAAQFNEVTAERLVKRRGISFETFQNMRAGYHHVTGQYILPVFNAEGTNIVNIRLYDMNTIKNAAGCRASMYNLWDERLATAGTVVICEGEWDTLAALEMIEKGRVKNTVAIGVPGAGVFKADTLPLLRGKDVWLMYDNDEAGRNGTEKACKSLESTANRIFKVDWPEGIPNGFDVNDVLRKIGNPAEAWRELMGMLVGVEAKSDVVAIEYTEDAPPAADVYEAYRRWLHLPDTTILDVMFGTIIANRMGWDPLWMFIVAPPGATKTEPLLSLTGHACIETVSSLTPPTLISGANLPNGGDPSLIRRINGRMLVVKDFTAVLGLPITEREEIFSILRDAFDGECRKPFGNGVIREYKSKFGILAAVTPSIELFTEDHASLGERFLRWRNYVPIDYHEERYFVRRAMQNTGHEVEMRKELVEMAHSVLNSKYTVVPEIPDGLQNKIVSLAQFIARLRGTVHRDRYHKDITHNSFTEMPTRIAKQLFALTLGVSMFRQIEVATEDEYDILVRVARGSVPQRLFNALMCVYRRLVDENIAATGSAEVVASIGLPQSTVGMVLDNLVMLGALRREAVNGGTKHLWSLQPDMIRIIEECEIFHAKHRIDPTRYR